MALLCRITVNATVRRIAYGARALDNYQWHPYLIGFDPVRFSMAKDYGGYVSIPYGQIELSPDLFADTADWPPPRSCVIDVKYLDTNSSTDEDDAVAIFVGTAFLAGIKKDGISYQLYGPAYDVNLLDEDTDYDGNTVAFPRAFGVIGQQAVVRIADVGGKPTYHKAGIFGTLGTNYHVFDDGVNIDANAVDNGTTFSLNVAPVGEVTLSGTGVFSGLSLTEIFEWACGASYLNLTYDGTMAQSPSPTPAFWAYSQQTMLDFLSDIAAYFSHVFYISGSTLYLVDMAEDNGSKAIDDYDFFKGGKYYYNAPVSLITSKWNTREAVEETIGKYVKTFDHETSFTTDYPYGSAIEIKPYHTTVSSINSILEDIEVTLHSLWIQVSMPLSSDFPVPGEKITITDTALKHDIVSTFHVRTILMDFDQNRITIEGEGSIS